MSSKYVTVQIPNQNAVVSLANFSMVKDRMETLERLIFNVAVGFHKNLNDLSEIDKRFEVSYEDIIGAINGILIYPKVINNILIGEPIQLI